MSKIPVERVEFFWNAEVGELPSEFVVTDRAHRLRTLRETGFDSSKYLYKSLGAHVQGWMDGSAINSPEGVFALAFLRHLELGQLQAIRDGLEEFSKIDGQEWAERMLGALEEIGRRSAGSEE